MFRRPAFLLLCSLAAMLAAASAKADPTFTFLQGSQDPANFESAFQSCINEIEAKPGLSSSILNQLNNAKVTVYYREGAAGVDDPNPGDDTTGKLLYLYWDSALSGNYEDDAPKVPCAVLLGALQHSARFFTGKACNGPLAGNQAAHQYDSKTDARAENFWLQGLHLKQRTTYRFSGDELPLGRWTRWPPSPDAPVPPQPKCTRSCPASAALAGLGGAGGDLAAAAACQRCIRFQQPGCVDFRGGIYSGGDHRQVANGSLRIIIGDLGYCQGRNPCEFKKCVTCPHLDTAFPKGVRVTAIATPGKDSRFERWGPGACRGQGPTCTFVAQRNSCISAQFLLTNPTAPPQSLPKVPCPR